MSFCVETDEAAGQVILYLGGTLGREALEALRDAVESMSGAARRLVLDVQNVTRIDTCGLGMLLIARESTEDPRPAIRGASQDFVRTLRLFRFGMLFELE